jgi:hypothetical protein
MTDSECPENYVAKTNKSGKCISTKCDAEQNVEDRDACSEQYTCTSPCICNSDLSKRLRHNDCINCESGYELDRIGRNCIETKEPTTAPTTAPAINIPWNLEKEKTACQKQSYIKLHKYFLESYEYVNQYFLYCEDRYNTEETRTPCHKKQKEVRVRKCGYQCVEGKGKGWCVAFFLSVRKNWEHNPKTLGSCVLVGEKCPEEALMGEGTTWNQGKLTHTVWDYYKLKTPPENDVDFTYPSDVTTGIPGEESEPSSTISNITLTALMIPLIIMIF